MGYALVGAGCSNIVPVLYTAVGKQTGQRNLCLAGGVALNCVANGVLSRSGRFDSIWLQAWVAALP